MQKAHKAARAFQYRRPLQRHIVSLMEIRVHSRACLVRYKGCTNTSCIQSWSYWDGEFKNGKLFSVQKAHRSARAFQYHRPLQRHIVSSMEIRVHSRACLARYKGCTNTRCIQSWSYWDEKFKNGKLFSVQKVHKAARAFQWRRPLQRPIVPSFKIRVHSRVCLARYKGCTNAMCI